MRAAPARDRAGRAAAVTVCAGLALSGCLGSGSKDKQQQPTGAQAFAPINLADCDGWRKASARQRTATVRQIREFAGGSTGSSTPERGATLDDRDAYRLFERYCANGFASHFKLYKLYTRAASIGAR